jgi:hypothetical protein
MLRDGDSDHVLAATKITGWRRGSQSVKLILLFFAISLAYASNHVGTTQTERDSWVSETHLLRCESI